MHDTWEYQVIDVVATNNELKRQSLNEWGEKGWELVSFSPGQFGISAVFKRKKTTRRRITAETGIRPVEVPDPPVPAPTQAF